MRNGCVVTWPLCRAIARCHGRRLGDAVRATPFLGALLMMIPLVPLLLARAGRALGETLAPVLAEDAAARGVVMALFFCGASAGMALALSVPGRVGLGAQIAAAPASNAAVAVATVMVPAGALTVVVLPSLLATTLPLASRAPGGTAAGVGLALVPFAGAVLGAAIVEPFVHAMRDRLRTAVTLIVLAAGWTAVVDALRDPLGPLAPAARALAGRQSPELAAALVAAVVAVSTFAWLAAFATRPLNGRSDRRSRTCRLVFGPALIAVPLAAISLVQRRGDVRLACVAGIVLGAVGVVLARVTGAVAPAPLLLGGSTVAIATAFAPLVSPGAAAVGRSLWIAAPLPRSAVPLAWALAGLLVALASAAPVVALALVISGGHSFEVARIGFIALLTCAAALMAGAFVPIRGRAAGDQLPSFAAFAAGMVAVSAFAGIAGGQLAGAGVPDAVAAALVGALAAAAAVAATAVRLRRGC